MGARLTFNCSSRCGRGIIVLQKSVYIMSENRHQTLEFILFFKYGPDLQHTAVVHTLFCCIFIVVVIHSGKCCERGLLSKDKHERAC